MSNDNWPYIQATLIRLEVEPYNCLRSSDDQALNGFTELFRRNRWGAFELRKGKKAGYFIIASPDLKNLSGRDLEGALANISGEFSEAVGLTRDRDRKFNVLITVHRGSRGQRPGLTPLSTMMSFSES